MNEKKENKRRFPFKRCNKHFPLPSILKCTVICVRCTRKKESEEKSHGKNSKDLFTKLFAIVKSMKFKRFSTISFPLNARRAKKKRFHINVRRKSTLKNTRNAQKKINNQSSKALFQFEPRTRTPSEIFTEKWFTFKVHEILLHLAFLFHLVCLACHSRGKKEKCVYWKICVCSNVWWIFLCCI